MMRYKHFEIKAQPFEGEILYEILFLGKLQYAITHYINLWLRQKWVVTPETYSETINDHEVQEIGAFIESSDL